MIKEIEKIISISNQKVKFIKSLYLRKNRNNSSLFIAEGERNCREAIEHKWKPKYLIYSKDKDKAPNICNLINECKKNNGFVLNVTTKILGKISRKDNPQNMLGIFEQKYFKTESLKDDDSTAWLVVERVRDPGNLGTIFRTCNATGIKSVILVGNCCDPYSPECVRASMGAIFSVKIICLSLEDFLSWAKQKENKLIVTSLKAKKFYTECNWGKKPIIVMGNEQAGVSEKIENSAEELIKLPMMGTSDSLNLSVSTGILLYEILKNKK